MNDAELITLTRAAPTRALGLEDRGHLGEGAMADVVVADRVWAKPAMVIKAGRVVIEDGDAVARAEAGMRLSAATAKHGAA